jgi:hypothetical protein
MELAETAPDTPAVAEMPIRQVRQERQLDVFACVRGEAIDHLSYRALEFDRSGGRVLVAELTRIEAEK